MTDLEPSRILVIPDEDTDPELWAECKEKIFVTIKNLLEESGIGFHEPESAVLKETLIYAKLGETVAVAHSITLDDDTAPPSGKKIRVSTGRHRVELGTTIVFDHELTVVPQETDRRYHSGSVVTPETEWPIVSSKTTETNDEDD